MKVLPILFIFCCYSVFSQSFGYSLDDSDQKTAKAGREIGNAKNQPEEDMYFKAYLLPIERAFELQQVLDKYGAVRLEKGKYPGTPIVLKTGQKLIGHPSITKLDVAITIKAGSSKVRLQNINPKTLRFEAGAPIKNCILKTVQYTNLNCTNCSLEDNDFINMDKVVVRFDSSESGYFRNNKFVKLWSHTKSPQTVMKGNTTTPSYGNVILWRNYLLPQGDATDFSQLESLTLVGIDAESWNFQNQGNKPLLYMRKMGDVKIGGFSGLQHGKYPTPAFDIEAKNLWMLGKNIHSRSAKDIVRPGTDLLMLSGKHEEYSFDNNSSSFNFKAYFKEKGVFINNKKIASNASTASLSKLEGLLIKKDVKTWERPFFHKIPNPVSEDRMAARAGKPDQSSEIQKLIDKNGIAELEEGIYYIAKPLVIRGGQGIIGKGSGKTAIVGITDDFPLIYGKDDVTKQRKTSVRYFLAHMTLQGGEKGLYVNPVGKQNNYFQLSSCTFKHLNFRNQKNGIHFDQFYGVDNNFFDNVNFIDCEIGVFQEPDPTFDVHKGETGTMMYLDKNVFYKSQIIRCGVGFSLLSRRPNQLNAWIDCEFNTNGISVDMEEQINPIFANCNFRNNTGEYIIGRERSGSFYNCDFTNNSVRSVFKLQSAYIEGSRFYGTARLFSEWSTTGFISNSMVQGSLGTMENGLLINNNFTRIPSLNYHMVEMHDKKTIRMMDQKSDAKPQFLVWKN